MTGQVRAYLGMSLDGRIAGPDHSLDWLDAPRSRADDGPEPTQGGTWLSFEQHMASVGVLLMGRTTFDVISGFDWPYGELPVVTATHRLLPKSAPSTVTTATGTVAEVIDAARERADGADVYIDGGQLVCSAIDSGLLDELTTTILPTVQGPGIALFDALRGPHELTLTNTALDETGAVQLTWRPKPPTG
ncbi:MAG: dihydrofolate reductase family protein [Candidatus Microthrix parvicella]|jgi:dihydrofolate reductase